MAPLFFSPIDGARLWVHFGSLEFQPIEFSKILLCIFFASYFAANKEMLSIPTAQIGNRLFLDPRPLIPILVAWGAAMAVIGLEDDIGFAALLFVLFIGMLWIATGRVGYLVLGLRPLRRRRLSSRPATSGRCTCRVDAVAEPVADHGPIRRRTQLAAARFGLGHRRRRRHRPRPRPPTPDTSPS